MSKGGYRAIAKIIIQKLIEKGYNGQRPYSYIDYWDDETLQALADILERMGVTISATEKEDNDTTTTLQS